MAARGVCIYYIVGCLLNVVVTSVAVTYPDCWKVNSDIIEYTIIIISGLGAVAYAWFAVGPVPKKSSSQALFVLSFSIAYQVVLMGASFCRAAGYTKNPREVDPALMQFCFEECVRQSANVWGARGREVQRCRYTDTVASGVTGLILSVLLNGYFTFVLWSFYYRIKHGTADEHPGIVVQMVQLQGPALAMPVQGAAGERWSVCRGGVGPYTHPWGGAAPDPPAWRAPVPCCLCGQRAGTMRGPTAGNHR